MYLPSDEGFVSYVYLHIFCVYHNNDLLKDLAERKYIQD